MCVYTAEFFLQIREKLFSSHRVAEQLYEAKAPVLHTQFSRHSNSISAKHRHTEQLLTFRLNIGCTLVYIYVWPCDSRFRIHVPKHDIICDPGVAGKTSLHYGVVGVVLLTVLNVTAQTHTHAHTHM